MAVLEPVHVLEQDRATAKMELTKINATRSFAQLGPTGTVVWTWQNGKWFGVGGQEVPAEIVPEEFRLCIRDYPVVITTQGPTVVTTCEFCGETMNRSEKEAHLIAHVRNTLGATGALPPANPSPPKEEDPPPAPPVRQRVIAAG